MTMLYNFLTMLYAEMGQSGCESRTPVDLRDMVLPKLISGELRLKDAERIVEIA